ncbi:MAG: hypothetical protein IIB12_10005, partial [Chloroflexi bacterium]|nr:hypothetical protein [Chloroflexota bacterium]
MVTKASGRAAEIRAKLDHPIIDSDGHLIEVLPVLLDFIKQVGGADVAKRFEDLRQRGTWMDLSPDELRDSRATASTWWLPPTKNTLDRATASLPRLLAERMDDDGVRGQAFNFSTEEPRSVLEVVQRILALMGSDKAPEVLNQAANELPTPYLDAVYPG